MDNDLDKLKKVLIDLNIYNEKIYNLYIKKSIFISCTYSEFSFGCFPVYLENILKSFNIVVPNIMDLNTLLINIHEYTHAYELYENFNTYYLIDTEISEIKAVNNERKYIYSRLINILRCNSSKNT